MNLFGHVTKSCEAQCDYLSEIKVPLIREDNKYMLDKFPTFENCTEAVNCMKHDKSLGLYELPSEFY